MNKGLALALVAAEFTEIGRASHRDTEEGMPCKSGKTPFYEKSYRKE